MASVSDQLANERTFLAYLRTALASIGFGFVIARFGLFVREAQLLQHGSALVAVLILFGIALAYVLYRTGP